MISVRHGSAKSHVALRARCEATPDLLSKGPGFVLYALMDFIVDQYFPVVEGLEERLDELEEQIFGERFTRDTTAHIYRLKRDLLALKRAVSPLVDVCNRLMRFDFAVIPEDTRLYFRDIYDHVLRVNEMIDTLRELLTTALEANLLADLGLAERGYEASGRVGRHHRGADDDRGHLWHELRPACRNCSGPTAIRS